MAKIKYKHKFSLRVGEIAHINGIPCEYLGMGNFGTNTYPGKPTEPKCTCHPHDLAYYGCRCK